MLRGDHDEGIATLREQVLAQPTDAMAQLFARAEVARGLLGKGELELAHAEAQKTIDDAGFLFQPHKSTALAILAEIAIARGDRDAALKLAREGRAIGEQSGMDALTASTVRAIEAELSGDAEIVATAVARIEAIARELAPLGLEPAWRAIPVHARTLAL